MVRTFAPIHFLNLLMNSNFDLGSLGYCLATIPGVHYIKGLTLVFETPKSLDFKHPFWCLDFGV
jgi:hypothetical protein